jgi:hypothetical protein
MAETPESEDEHEAPEPEPSSEESKTHLTQIHEMFETPDSGLLERNTGLTLHEEIEGGVPEVVEATSVRAPDRVDASQEVAYAQSVTAVLVPVHGELIAFARQVLLEGQVPRMELQKIALLPQAFDDETWRDSPLLKHWRTDLATLIRQADSGEALLRGLWDWAGSIGGIYDEDMHAERERIGQAWAILSLAGLSGDYELMRVLTLGGERHVLRTVPLRLRPTLNDRLLDLGPGGTPRWHLGPLSVFYAYCAFLIYVIGSESLVRRLALPEEMAQKAEEIENALSRTRRQLRLAIHQVSQFIHDREQFLTPGDLLVADGFVAGLLKVEATKWAELAPLARVSPISRILRADALALLAGGSDAYRQGLGRWEIEKGRPEPRSLTVWTGLLCLAGTDQLPGLHRRVSQCIADACAPGRPPHVFAEMASAIETLVGEVERHAARADVALEESAYQVGRVLWRAYCLAERDGTLKNVRGRQAEASAYLSGLRPAGLIYQLRRRAASEPRHGTPAEYLCAEVDTNDLERMTYGT